MKNVLSLMGLLAAVLTQSYSPAAQVPDAWKPFEFLVGDWVGSGSGKPGEGSGAFSLKFDLDQKILLRRNRNQIAPTTNHPEGAVHEDLMIIYQPPGNSAFRADYWDSEGHVIHYAVSVAEHRAVFESDGAGNTTRFRLTYELEPDGLLNVVFAVAGPGKPFQTYVSGTARRK